MLDRKKSKSQCNIGAPSIQSLIEEPDNVYPLQDFNLIRLSRQGVSKKTLLLFIEQFSLSMEVFRILRIPERTLQWHKAEDVLAPDISERVLLLVQLYKKGVLVFDTPKNFNDWLHTPLLAFNRQAPIEYLDTIFGFQVISDELSRIQHGIFF
jgi:putative toxin-antitoxin system antitoxin component (TIGR02293 family)